MTTKLGFTFEDIGEQVVKNIARPIHAYRVRFEGVEFPAAAPRTAAPPGKGVPRLSIVVLPSSEARSPVVGHDEPVREAVHPTRVGPYLARGGLESFPKRGTEELRPDAQDFDVVAGPAAGNWRATNSFSAGWPRITGHQPKTRGERGVVKEGLRCYRRLFGARFVAKMPGCLRSAARRAA